MPLRDTLVVLTLTLSSRSHPRWCQLTWTKTRTSCEPHKPNTEQQYVSYNKSTCCSCFFRCQGHFLYSRIPPVENGPFRLESSGPSSYRQSSRFYSFCALHRDGWCEGKSVAARCFAAFSASNGSTNPRPKRVGGFRLGGFELSLKPPQLRLWSCTQPRAAKATAGAAVVGSTGSTPRAVAVV